MIHLLASLASEKEWMKTITVCVVILAFAWGCL